MHLGEDNQHHHDNNADPHGYDRTKHGFTPLLTNRILVEWVHGRRTDLVCFYEMAAARALRKRFTSLVQQWGLLK